MGMFLYLEQEYCKLKLKNQKSLPAGRQENYNSKLQNVLNVKILTLKNFNILHCHFPF